MKRRRRSLRKGEGTSCGTVTAKWTERWIGLVSVVVLWSLAGVTQAGTAPNTITFDNQSGEAALVKLVGPSSQAVTVPNGHHATVHAAVGEYYILVRYGTAADGYRFTKGDPFTVTQTATEYSIIRITLHPVVAGNYETEPISQAEFEQAQVGEGEDPRGEGQGAGKGLAAAAPGPENPEQSAGLPKTITGRDGAPMVLVPDGAFWMGTSHDEVARLVEDCVSEGFRRTTCERSFNLKTAVALPFFVPNPPSGVHSRRIREPHWGP